MYICIKVKPPTPQFASLHSSSPPPVQVVAYLGTGSGKPFIAVLLQRHRLEQHALRAAAAAQGGDPAPAPWQAVFLAPKVALVQQQAEVLRRALPVKVAQYIGTDVEGWRTSR